MNKLVSHRGVSRILGGKFRNMRVKHTLLGRPNFIGHVTHRRGTHGAYKRDGCYVNHVCDRSVMYRRGMSKLPTYLGGRVRTLRKGWCVNVCKGRLNHRREDQQQCKG